jgi:hypothetical protein
MGAKKYDPKLISSFKTRMEAMAQTGISRQQYKYLCEKYSHLKWPKDLISLSYNRYDPVKISSFKSADEAVAATGIQRQYYRKLMLKFPQLPWPHYEHLPRKNTTKPKPKPKNCFVDLPQESKKISKETLEFFRQKLKGQKKHALASLNFMV